MYCAQARHPFYKAWQHHIQRVFEPCIMFMEEPSQFSVGQTAQILTCYIMEKPHTGLDDCLIMLLPCLRKVMSGAHIMSAQETLSHHNCSSSFSKRCLSNKETFREQDKFVINYSYLSVCPGKRPSERCWHTETRKYTSILLNPNAALRGHGASAHTCLRRKEADTKILLAKVISRTKLWHPNMEIFLKTSSQYD